MRTLKPARAAADQQRRRELRELRSHRPWDRWTGRAGGRRWRALRRLLAVALVVAAGLSAGWQTTRGPGVPVVAVARDLPLGAALLPSDLTEVRMLDPPDGALTELAAVTGSRLGSPARRGEVLTDARLVRPAGPDPGPGRVAVVVRPADPALTSLLQPGMTVSVVGVGPDGATTTLCSDGIVLSVLDDSGDRSTSRPVLLAAPLADADRLAAGTLTDEIALRLS